MATVSIKYPRTSYWPYSPVIGRGDGVHRDPFRQFVGEQVVVTEKLDGSNTLLHAGHVYGRSVAVPSDAKWLAMVKKHHAWKVTEPGVYLYGEDIYGMHSITYEPVQEDQTFHAFALRDRKGDFASFEELENYARQRKIPVVPVLFRGCFETLAQFQFLEVSSSKEPTMRLQC